MTFMAAQDPRVHFTTRTEVKLYLDGTDVLLGAQEDVRTLLRVLDQHRGERISLLELERDAWGLEASGKTNTVRMKKALTDLRERLKDYTPREEEQRRKDRQVMDGYTREDLWTRQFPLDGIEKLFEIRKTTKFDIVLEIKENSHLVQCDTWKGPKPADISTESTGEAVRAVAAQCSGSADTPSVTAAPPERAAEVESSSVAATQQYSRRKLIGGLGLSYLAGLGTDSLIRSRNATEGSVDAGPIAKAYELMGERTEAKIRQAIVAFNVAEVKGGLRACIGLCTAHCLLGYYGFVAMQEAFKVAQPFFDETDRIARAEKRLEDCEVLTLQAWWRLLKWQIVESGTSFGSALDHESKSFPQGRANLHQWYSLFKIVENQLKSNFADRFADSFTHIGMAVAIGSSPVIPKSMAQRYYLAGAFEAANQYIETLERRDAATTSNSLILYWHGLTLLQLGHPSAVDKLRAAWEASKYLNRSDHIMRGAYAHALIVSPKKRDLSEAEAIFHELEQTRKSPQSGEGYVSPMALAMIAVGWHDYATTHHNKSESITWRQKALEFLQEAQKERCVDLFFLGLEPRYRLLRDNEQDPEFLKFQNTTFGLAGITLP